MTNGVLYIIWKNGENYTQWDYSKLLDRSIASAKKFGYNYHVAEIDRGRFGNKTQMYDLSPFDNTLYLDVDTVICNPVDFGWQQSTLHGISVCLERASVLPRWSKEMGFNLPYYPEYNTGVIFFNKTDNNKKFFDQWNYNHKNLNFWADQPSFTLTCRQLSINPFVLPENWNYRRYCKTDFSLTPIHIWHNHEEITSGIEKELAEKGPGFSRIGA